MKHIEEFIKNGITEDEEFKNRLGEFVVSRCSDAVIESEEYEKLQSENCDKDELLDIALLTGYKKGVYDVIKMFALLIKKM
ncbi:hypothetical protein C8E03_1022 [Lachnotalea glycerini]|uniref:Uncharacterized protein n=1 Tax=Lachnotalea glycerini TaxID=1763509 RepID=A0A318EQL1_9FIRM|nr:hypothetical protein [Lachnotalea glycerini]PXV93236.1 hypothetical protein C8E03_1022 [Lachnotalea glycerini]